MTNESLRGHNSEEEADLSINRREILGVLAGLGVGTVVFQRALAAEVVAQKDISAEMIEQAEWVANIELSEEDRKATARGVKRIVSRIQSLRRVEVDYPVAPALAFIPSRGKPPANAKRIPAKVGKRQVMVPDNDEDLAFMSVAELATLVRTRKVTSTRLTKLYLERLKKYDPVLRCVVTLTEELALKQAGQADKEIAAGKYRGPLHGIPWGAKDLIAYPGVPTTWGAPYFKQQVLKTTATVAQRLEDAGAVMLGKLSLGALAMGDRWFGGMTRNPWKPDQGSSGSSAGSASATAAGLAAFTLGSETLGSIVSPSRRCGATGLRPTFGRVSRAGCMTLAWSMDKIGPITRSVEDCALVFSAIHGTDGIDATVRDEPFQWPGNVDLKRLRVGYVKSALGDERRDIKLLKEIGVQLVPIEMPKSIPASALTVILDVECATAFDDITREGITEGLNSWPGTFRRARFVSAIDYLRANRVRSLLMDQMDKVFDKVDLYVGGNDLVITNFTGHPTVVMPYGFRDGDWKTPYSITFTGRLYGETELLALSHAFQSKLDVHLQRPPLERVLEYGKAKEQEK